MKQIPYICVLDFEATCEDGCAKTFHEIIEFPSVLLKWNEKKQEYVQISEFQEYCKPIDNSRVTKYCHDLTGITQEQVNSGSPFPKTLDRHLGWLRDNCPEYVEYTDTSDKNDKECPLIILTCGDWDLKTMMPIECLRWQRSANDIYRHWYNIKPMFEDFYKVKRMGMAKMLQYSRMELLGRHHSGIDDCRNIARLVQKMTSDGYNWNDPKWINTIDRSVYEHKKDPKRTQKIKDCMKN